MEDDVDIVLRSFTVNCFQKKHTEWLPQAEIGDIVIFRRLKVVMSFLIYFKLLNELQGRDVQMGSQWRRV
jgi:hypothetical protein